MFKRICSLSSLIFLSAEFLYANENTAAAGTLTTCNNGITISFMISTIATQIILAVLIGRVFAKVNTLDEKDRNHIQSRDFLPKTFLILDNCLSELLKNPKIVKDTLQNKEEA